ncbi:hypothetical protein GGF32_005191 [Allomyces javanicus]|nr:hypothetical protein GGF32_005191 [Allomyces javanicus]
MPCTFISLEVIPFLTLAIGADNVFLLVEAREQIHVFPSTLTRFLLSFACELLIFLAAPLIDISSMSSFVLYAAAMVAALFLLQETLFVAMIAMILVPALKHSGAAWVRYTQILMRYRRALLATVMALSIGAALLLSNILLGLDQRVALPSDSRMVSYFDDLDQYFSMGPPVYSMTENVELRNAHWKAMRVRFTACGMNSIPSLLEQEQKRPNFSALASPATAWLDDFLYWLQPTDPEDELEEVPACCSRRCKNPREWCDQAADYIGECPGINITTMTQYKADFPFPTAQDMDNVLAEVLAKHNVPQCHDAETDKYALITFFFNGGCEKQFAGEAVAAQLATGKYPLVKCNFTNPDMVGHTGKLEPAIKAVEATDAAIGVTAAACKEFGYTLVITADHGNAEKMIAPNGEPHTAHTLLDQMGIEVPKDMDGKSVLV